MKIRLLIDARLLGGTETHVMNLCHALLANRHDCAIIFVRNYPDNPLYTQCKARNIPFYNPKRYRDLLQLIRKAQPDILHTHGYKANILGRIITLFGCGKSVATYHAGEPPVGRLRLYNFLDRWTSFLSSNIAVNAPIAAKIPFKADIIPNFVDIPKNSNPLKLQAPYSVYFIGRFSAEKDPLSFCKLAALTSEGINWHAVGDGPLLAKARHIANDSVQFHGAISNMNEVWPNVDMLCITSTSEGLPLVLLEAMSRGIPVVSFDVGSINSVIPNKNYVIKPQQLKKMHACIITHFSKPLIDRQDMAEEAREVIQNYYASPVITSKIETIYSRCINHD